MSDSEDVEIIELEKKQLEITLRIAERKKARAVAEEAEWKAREEAEKKAKEEAERKAKEKAEREKQEKREAEVGEQARARRAEIAAVRLAIKRVGETAAEAVALQ